MTDTTGQLPPAGWYPDPYGAPFERWWDGAGWTAHTNESAPAAPEPVAPKPVEPEPVAAEPAPAEPFTFSPPPLEEPPAATTDPFAGFVSPAEPAPYTPAAYEPAAYEPVAYEPAAYQPAAYEPAPAEPAPYEPTPAAERPVFGSDLFGQPDPAAQTPFTFEQPQPVSQADLFSRPAASSEPAVASSTASSFDFGFNELISGGTPSNTSVPAAAGRGEDGLFGSWEPNEYIEPPSNGLANAGLTLGILSFLLSAVTGLPGLILSVLGIGRSARFAREGDGPVGRGKAIAGLALSIIGTAVSAAVILWAVQFFTGTADDTADGTGDGSTPVDEALLTQNGGFGLEVGDTGTITLPDSDAAAIQFTVTEITPAFTCTAPDALSPENGEFVAVAMNFTLSADYLGRMTDGAPLHMSQSDWMGFLADDGGTQVINTDAGNSCIPAAEQLPADFPAGENVSGTVVLDMSADVAAISWGPSGVSDLDPGITRWEWTLPA